MQLEDSQQAFCRLSVHMIFLVILNFIFFEVKILIIFPSLFISRSTKCELAKMKNKETCYETILKKRDSLISELDGKVEQLQEVQRSEKTQWV